MDKARLLHRPGSAKSYPPVTSVQAAAAATALTPIQINQNWFAKFFHIKPASKIFVLQISRMRAKKDIFRVMKNWKKYGLKDVRIERRAGQDVIRGRVDAQNCELSMIFQGPAGLTKVTDFHMKPVEFHAHLFSVLDQGRKANLSIVKLTQERGAASTFYKVCETLEMVLKEREMLMADAVKRKDIERTMKETGY